MRHETILKREDGSRVKIVVAIVIDIYRWSSVEYQSEVYTCEKGKRTWLSTYDTNDWSYRKLSREERETHIKNSKLNVATEKELLDAKISAWQSIKPV